MRAGLVGLLLLSALPLQASWQVELASPDGRLQARSVWTDGTEDRMAYHANDLESDV